MREPGFDELADLWQDPDGKEQEAFEALARRARRHGRLMAYGDLALGIVIVGGTALGVFMTPHPGVILLALLLLGLTTLVTWQRRKLRQMAPTLNTADRSAFLESSMRNANANLRRVTLSIIFSPLALIVGVMFKRSLKDNRFWDHPVADMTGWALSLRGLFGFSVLAVALLLLIRSRRKLRRELRGLQQLDRDYAEEREREGESIPS
jgi:hypothetical protein